MAFKILGLMAFFTMLVACADQKKLIPSTVKPNSAMEEVRNDSQSAIRKNFDESFDPRSLNDDVWELRSHSRATALKEVSGYSFDFERKTLIRDEKDVSVMGYRVQLFVSTNYYEALALRDSAAAKMTENVYFDYEQPYYKIRLGNFTEREKAEGVKERAKSLGYPDAWVIQTKVIIRNN
jgi:hypothetical protein